MSYDRWKTTEPQCLIEYYGEDLHTADEDPEMDSLEDSLEGHPDTVVDMGCFDAGCRCINCRTDRKLLRSLVEMFAGDVGKDEVA